jgi:hypothetical protein
MKRDVIEAMSLADGDNYYFESLMAQMGNGINAEGGHGSSWGGGEKGIIATVNSDGTISYRLGSTENLNWCEHCDVYYSGKSCPLCGISSQVDLTN